MTRSDLRTYLYAALALISALALVALTSGCNGPCVTSVEEFGLPPQYARCLDPRARLEVLPSGAAARCVCPGGAK